MLHFIGGLIKILLMKRISVSSVKIYFSNRSIPQVRYERIGAREALRFSVCLYISMTSVCWYNRVPKSSVST